MVVEGDPAGRPAEVTSYIGRRHEIAEARKLLETGRLVTLTGPGGVGKTRLAHRIAAAVGRQFPDGVAFIELAELRDPELLANLVADKLGLRDQSARAAADTVAEHLRERAMLLVLDNCEHLVVACAHLAGRLIASCPRLVIVATSRQSLSVDGEHLLWVPPLAVPREVGSPAELANYESVRLFVDRATAVLPSFEITEENCADLAQLCARLEGLPLAIELAAVRCRSMSVRQIAERLSRRLSLLTMGSRTAPERQQTLRATIDWSYSLCSRGEQLVWERASVFSGSFDLAAAEHVCGGSGVERAQVLDLIDGLLDKSVLIREEHQGIARFRMLETLREYAQDRLDRGGERLRVSRLHRDWYAGLIERFEAEWLSARQVDWVDRLRQDHANLRVALDFCVTDPADAVIGLRMATRLDDYWGIRGFHTEARLWLDRALAAAAPDAPERAAALRMSGWFALLQDDVQVGVSRLAEAGELLAASADPVQEAYLAHAWGMAALFSGDLAKAAETFAEVLSAFRAHGELRGELFTLFIYGYTLGVGGDPGAGRAMLREAVDTSSATGETFWRAWALWALAQIEISDGDVDAADRAGKEALRLERTFGNRLGEAFSTDLLAWVAQRQGRHARAAMLFGAASAIWTMIGSSPSMSSEFKRPHDEYLKLNRQALGEPAFQKSFAEGRALPSDLAMHYALEEDTAEAAVDSERLGPLTKREFEIAQLVAEGLTNREIAGRLTIARRTAESHVEHILTKLGFTTRTQIAAWVARESVGPR
ncbi:ATP-binding protein [Actinokineospora iranica]|uniref:Non-specific serine/threonine protein kinase n=1 Tax=Actinokineospora iranica TaxID=1271860 RepID=A0A1G6UAX6_9PSEU|nr:LuxR C-terminal-related transcriptional regulator [Actinokineospora iranica]SDD37735.1 non-specific serine/threonine protein kinase [Actinokineospora iranica]